MQKLNQLPISCLYAGAYITAVESWTVGRNASTKLKIGKVYKILEVHELDLAIEFNAELTRGYKNSLGVNYSNIITKNLGYFRLAYKNEEKLCVTSAS